MVLLPGGGNWVDGGRFFDREGELAELRERVQNGTHTLLTAQRRMGKTSLVRELLRRLDAEEQVATVFVDLEDSMDAADAAAELAIQSRRVQGAWARFSSWFTDQIREVRDNVEEVGVSELRIRLRAGMDAGSWQRTGDQVFEALAASDKPVVLAVDELPIMVNRLLKGHDYRITPERREAADRFLSWLRRNGQTHRGQVSLIVSGSVGLGPILQQAGLSAQANIFTPLELRPWSQETSLDCLAALARGQKKDLPAEVRMEMCRRLRCCVPHHVQQFFQHLNDHLNRDQRHEATIEDVRQVYEHELLSIRGQIDLVHYESRLRTVLGDQGFTTALALLTEAAVKGGLLTHETVGRYRESRSLPTSDGDVSIDDVLHTLEHDGYLERQAAGYGFVSGLLEDWWRYRYGQNFTSLGRDRSG